MRMSRLISIVALAAAVAITALTGTAQASGFYGSSVTVTGYYPDPIVGDIWGQAGPVTVGPGVEFLPGVIYPPRSSAFGFDITNTQIIYYPNENITYGGGSPTQFNGFELSFSGAPQIVGITLDGATTLTPYNMSFTGTEVFLNYLGATVSISQQTVVDVQFASATPLPSTWLMMLSGFVGLGFFAYRGTKKNIAALAAA
jgi:hypothetical protein